MKKSVLKNLIKEEFQQLMEATDWVKHYSMGDVGLGKELRDIDDQIEGYWKKAYDKQIAALKADAKKFVQKFANKKLEGSFNDAIIKGIRIDWDNDGDPNIEFKLETVPIKENVKRLIKEGEDPKVLKVLNSAQVNLNGYNGHGHFDWDENNQSYTFDDEEGGFDYDVEVKPISAGFKVSVPKLGSKSFSNIEAVKKYLEQLEK